MIPTIERIIEELLEGKITKQQAIGWLHQHAEDAYRDLRDDFAAAALQGMMSYYNESRDFHTNSSFENNAKYAYQQADAMLKAREQ
jgi:uncharacterized protein YehS (DUF1456 family)